jgi:predicted Fe-Mo cluster-binding NifX family protein
MARLKFKVGGQEASLALVADAEHDRADVVASIGVLVGLFLIPYFKYADSIIALLVGLYIIWETIELGREAIDSLVDVADEELENEIKNILKKEKIKLDEIKSRKIGGASFAEIKIDLPSDLKLDQATQISQKVEDILLDSFENLKQVVVRAKSHDISRSAIKSGFGRLRGRGPGRGIEPIDFPKKGKTRVIIPVEDGESNKFGVRYYKVKDFDENNKLVQEKKIENPFWSNQGGHGVKFAKAIGADKVISKHIGDNAKANLETAGIEIEEKDGQEIAKKY